MIRIRERSPLVILLAGVVLAYIAGTSLYAIGSAHGDTLAAPAVEHVLVSAGPVLQAAAPFDLSTVVVVLAVVLGGIGTILGGASTILHAVAARTKTTVDDRAAAAVDAAHAKLDELLALFRVSAPPAGATTTTVNVAAPAVVEPVAMSIPGGPRGPAAMLAVLLLSGLAVSQTSCSGTAGDRAGTLVNGVLDCESPQLVAAALAAGNLAQAAIISTISGSGHVDTVALKAALTGIKDAGLMCAVSATIAMLAKPAVKQPGAAMAAGLEVQGDELRAAFAQARVDLGWPQMVVR